MIFGKCERDSCKLRVKEEVTDLLLIYTLYKIPKKDLFYFGEVFYKPSTIISQKDSIIKGET